LTNPGKVNYLLKADYEAAKLNPRNELQFFMGGKTVLMFAYKLTMLMGTIRSTHIPQRTWGL
jgi:hypothetical protein